MNKREAKRFVCAALSEYLHGDIISHPDRALTSEEEVRVEAAQKELSDEMFRRAGARRFLPGRFE